MHCSVTGDGMKRIDQIDRNMTVVGILNRDDIQWYSPKEEPFLIHGLYKPNLEKRYRRIPGDVAAATSEGVEMLSTNTTGGRVRFVTDSPYIAIHAEYGRITKVDHMPACGVCGFDLYIRNDEMPDTYCGTFRPPVNQTDGYESQLRLPGSGKWEVTINFPLYNDVDLLLIGLKKGSRLERAKDYRIVLPVVYYGSSITQGGCASRPGNSYQAIISRMLDCDYINLGFSGSARGEQAIADYMAGLSMSAFVCDYDHNAPSVDHLRRTHENLYQTIRKANPDIPILLISRPDVLWKDDTPERTKVILETFEHAVEQGDLKVAFIDGARLFEGPMADSCTVDGSHPNDLGFMRMAQVIGMELKRWICA